ncbi:hypothetical protein B0H19DRAFT_451653 [Mycena capillaripes]|nr:hypothetical protein B0H19DRAFT_451653 [Mycena capillaripes]
MERALQITSAKLRGMRNSVQPINRLPPELLVQIFSETQLRLPSFLPIPSTGGHGHVTLDWCRWMFLLQVCRHWRGVIASSPALWSIVCSSAGAREFIRRSHGADLTVYLGVRDRGFSSSLMEALAPHTSRLKEFHMLAKGTEDLLKHQLFASPAPRLNSLLIEVEEREDLSGVLPPIFCGHMPKLKQLALGYFTSWPKDYFHNLTSLCLYDQRESSLPTTTKFLDFLESSPRIEELALVRGGPIRPLGTDVVPPAGRIISLKRLRKLDFGEWPSALYISRLLAHIGLPRKTELYIWGNVFADQEDMGSLLPEHASHLLNLKRIKEWYFIRQIQTCPYVSFKLISVVDSTLYMIGAFSHPQILPSVLSRFQLNKVKSLVLREDSTQFRRFRISDWKDMLRLVPALRSLSILATTAPQCTRAVISALRPPKLFPPLLPSLSGVVCPALKTVDITEELDLPFLHICSLSAERLACGAPEMNFKFRGMASPPLRGFSPVAYDSDSDSDLDYGFGAVGPGTHLQSVEYVKIDERIRVAPMTWPTQAYHWSQVIDRGY